MIPRYVFLVRGIGYHKEQLVSFEEALRDAGIAPFNLVNVSSIFPPRCKLITAKKGLEKLKKGEIIFTVLSRNQTNESRRLIGCAIGVAIPKDRNLHGYISEHHAFGETEYELKNYVEDLATQMLSTTMGIEKENIEWDEKRQIWKIKKHIVRTTSISQTAFCRENTWTTTICAAVFVV